VLFRSLRNITHVTPFVAYDDGVAQDLRVVLADAQTSGGMLLACPHHRSDALAEMLRERGVEAARIGEVRQGAPGTIRVTAGR